MKDQTIRSPIHDELIIYESARALVDTAILACAPQHIPSQQERKDLIKEVADNPLNTKELFSQGVAQYLGSRNQS